MLDFEVPKLSRRCAATQRELKAGDKFFSVLVPEQAEMVRRDYAPEAWSGPPENALGWWTAEVPDPRANRLHWAPNDVLLHCFQQWHEDASKADFGYMLALLMIRRRVFKLETTETDPRGQQVLLVYCGRNENEYRVPVVTPDAARAAEIQAELAAMLFAKADRGGA
jgi:hypothetical protein